MLSFHSTSLVGTLAGVLPLGVELIALPGVTLIAVPSMWETSTQMSQVSFRERRPLVPSFALLNPLFHYICLFNIYIYVHDTFSLC